MAKPKNERVLVDPSVCDHGGQYRPLIEPSGEDDSYTTPLSGEELRPSFAEEGDTHFPLDLLLR